MFRKVVAIEFDRDMIAFLRERFGRSASLTLVDDDVLNVDLALLAADGGAKLVGNLPYNISTPILQKLIKCRDLFTDLVLMFQREVVDRITAQPGGRDRGYLSVLVENTFMVERLFDVPPTAFRPRLCSTCSRPPCARSMRESTRRRSAAGSTCICSTGPAFGRSLASARSAARRWPRRSTRGSPRPAERSARDARRCCRTWRRSRSAR